jgi:hypothetical protein
MLLAGIQTKSHEYPEVTIWLKFFHAMLIFYNALGDVQRIDPLFDKEGRGRFSDDC